MAYQTYITEALVCGSRASHTSDRSYLLFAREAGMVYATAKSVREERSKQRFALQEFSYIRATLVHGKSGWRVAGVEPIHNLYARAHTREARACIRNIVLLLRRTVQGETPHGEMFDEVVHMLSTSPSLDQKDLERILSLRILYTLGYVALIPAYAHLCEGNIEDITALTDEERAFSIETVARALVESQL